MGPIDFSTIGGDSLSHSIAALLVAARVVSPRWPHAIRHGWGLLDIKENKESSVAKCCVFSKNIAMFFVIAMTICPPIFG